MAANTTVDLPRDENGNMIPLPPVPIVLSPLQKAQRELQERLLGDLRFMLHHFVQLQSTEIDDSQPSADENRKKLSTFISRGRGAGIRRRADAPTPRSRRADAGGALAPTPPRPLPGAAAAPSP